MSKRFLGWMSSLLAVSSVVSLTLGGYTESGVLLIAAGLMLLAAGGSYE